MFEIGNKNSLNNALDYFIEIKKWELKEEKTVPRYITKKILVGTKNDLNGKLDREDKEKIKESFLKFYETSSLTNFRV